MGTRCLQYKNIEDLIAYIEKGKESSFKDATIITASMAMSRAMNNTSLFPKLNHHGINAVLDDMLTGWYDSETMLEQYLLLGKLLKDSAEIIEKKGHKNLAMAIRKNRNDFAKAIRLMMEAGIAPEDLCPLTDEEIIFTDTYRDFIKESKSAKKFLMLLKTWKNPKAFKAILRLAGVRCDERSTLYMQGFFYFTPLQKRFVKAVQDAGIDLCFLNNYDDEVKEAYKIWDINDVYNNIPKNNLPVIVKKPQFFSEVFNGNLCKNLIKPDVTITECKDIFSMVRMISDAGITGSNIFSPNAQEVRDLIDVFFPEHESKGRLLSYPIGQYLLSLYKMWNIDKNKLAFNVDNIRCCIATGWAGKDDRDYALDLDYFEKVAFYFDGCSTIEEWRERADLLASVNKEIVPLFGVPVSDDRWPSILENPLLPAACFNGNMQNMQNLLNILDDIMSDCQLLFADEHEIDLNKHFDALLNLIEHKASRKKINEKEKIIARETISRLNAERELIEKCSPDNLAETMTFFLGGQIEETQKALLLFRDDKGPVFDMSDIEAISIANKEQKFYLCFCDDRRMPGVEIELPWPISDELLERRCSPGQCFVYLSGYRNSIKNNGLISRYLFYRSMQVPKINFSWVSEYNGKVLSPSPYLRMLLDPNLYGVKLDNQYGNMIQAIKHDNFDCKEANNAFGDFTVKDTEKYERPAEIVINEKLCPYGNLRNIYEYGLQKYPAFRSGFHLELYASNLLQIMKEKAVTKRGDAESAAKELFSILPVFSEIRKRAILSDSNRYDHKNLERVNSRYNDLNYPDERMYLKYLRGDILVQFFNGSSEDSSKLLREFDSCTYCPNGDRCIGRYRGREDDN